MLVIHRCQRNQSPAGNTKEQFEKQIYYEMKSIESMNQLELRPDAFVSTVLYTHLTSEASWTVVTPP